MLCGRFENFCSQTGNPAAVRRIRDFLNSEYWLGCAENFEKFYLLSYVVNGSEIAGSFSYLNIFIWII